LYIVYEEASGGFSHAKDFEGFMRKGLTQQAHLNLSTPVIIPQLKHQPLITISSTYIFNTESTSHNLCQRCPPQHPHLLTSQQASAATSTSTVACISLLPLTMNDYV
jgi:hypothetical protein